MARRLLNAFRVLQQAIDTPRPRLGIVLLLTAIVALAGAVAWFVAAECGCRTTSRAQRVQAEVAAQESTFSAFGAFHRAFCTAPGDALVPNALQHDAWGTPYLFVCNAHTITVVSAGEDGQYMTADDIRSDR